MNDVELEREIRATFRRRGVDVLDEGTVPPAREVLRRTRRHQLRTIVTGLVVAAAVVVASVAGVGALIRSSERRVPSNPSETPAPSPTEPVPAVVTGSGLDGYASTTFAAPGYLRDLAIAPDGAVWAAAGESVVRFDGSTWTVYTTEDGLPSGWVRVVEVAPDGTVWAGTQHGLARLNGGTWAIVSPSLRVGVIAFAPDTSILVGRRRVSRFDGQTWQTLRDGVTMPDHVTGLDVDPSTGAVWVGRGAGWGAVGSVSRLDSSGWTTWLEPDWLSGGNVMDLTVAPDGSVWVLGNTLPRRTHGVLARFDGHTWTAFSLPRPAKGYRQPSTGAMALRPDGTIWVAVEKYVKGAAGNGLKVSEMLFSFDGTSWTQDRLRGSGYPALDVGLDGSIWVGANDSLVRYAPASG